MQPTATPRETSPTGQTGPWRRKAETLGSEGKGSREAGATDADREIDLRRAGQRQRGVIQSDPLFRGWVGRGAGGGGWTGSAEQECVFDGMVNSLRMKTQQKQGKARWSKEAPREKKLAALPNPVKRHSEFQTL